MSLPLNRACCAHTFMANKAKPKILRILFMIQCKLIVLSKSNKRPRVLRYLTFHSCWWSWRDSNSRPNEELICFLHVYLRLHCRGEARPKPPTYPLSSKLSPERRGLPQAISDIAAPPVRNASEPQHPGDVTSPQLLQGLSFNLLYFD